MKKIFLNNDNQFVSFINISLDIEPAEGYYSLILDESDIPEGINQSYYYENNIWVYKPPKTTDLEAIEDSWQTVKMERNRRLQDSDWTQLPDVPLTTKEAWTAYRQALRDITLQPDPFNITWPQPPT